jgi:hypothetical protein
LQPWRHVSGYGANTDSFVVGIDLALHDNDARAARTDFRDPLAANAIGHAVAGNRAIFEDEP